MAPIYTAQRAIESELRRLRTLPGPLTEAKFTTARVILRGFGGDDPQIALARLIDLAIEHSDKEVDAAMASMGWGVTSHSTLDRLTEYSTRHFVDQRTVRRWSDAGLKKLALLVIGKEAWRQPVGQLYLNAVTDDIKFEVRLLIPPHLRMNAPELTVAGQSIEMRMLPIAIEERIQQLRTGLEVFARREELPLELEFKWTGDKMPKYEIFTRGTSDVRFHALISFMTMRAAIERISEDSVRRAGTK